MTKFSSRTLDFALHTFIFFLYVMISPLLYGVVYPSTGDQAMIWIWVVMINLIASAVSLGVFIVLNFITSPDSTYKYKGIITLVCSSLLSFILGQPPEEVRIAFLLMNAGILILLYLLYIKVYKLKIEED